MQQRSSSSSTRSRKQLDPRALTARLKEAQTPEQLLQLVQQHAEDLNHIHLGAAFTRAKALRTEGVPLQQLSELLSQLRQLAQRLQQQCGARGLSNIIWSCSALNSRDTAAELLPVFLQSSKLHDAAPQAVSNVLWAAATLQLQLTLEQSQQLLQHFSSRQVLPQANPQAVSNTLLAVATMGQQVPPQQLQQLLDRFQQLLPQANPQDVSNTLLACGKLLFAPLQLLSALEQQPQQLQKCCGSSQATGHSQHSLGVWSAGVQQQAVAWRTAAAGSQAVAERKGCRWLECSRSVQPVLVGSSAGQSAVCAAGAAACSCRQSGVGQCS
jgi:hypothetical protein